MPTSARQGASIPRRSSPRSSCIGSAKAHSPATQEGSSKRASSQRPEDRLCALSFNSRCGGREDRDPSEDDGCRPPQRELNERAHSLSSGRWEEARLLDPSCVAGEWAFAEPIQLDLGDERLGILAPCLAEVGVQLDETRHDRFRKATHELGVRLSRDLEQKAGTNVAVRTLREREAERIRYLGEGRVLIQTLLDVLRIDVRTHDTDRVVAPPEDPQKGKAYVPVTAFTSELLYANAHRFDPFGHLIACKNAAEIMDVVPNARRQERAA